MGTCWVTLNEYINYSYQQRRKSVGKHQWVNQLITNQLVNKYPVDTNECNHVVQILVTRWLTDLFWHLLVNTLRPRQDGRQFPDDIFICIFLNENEWHSIKISPKFVPKVPINHITALVQIMAWRRPGDKPLSEPMMVVLPTHICVTRPQWVYSPSGHQLESDINGLIQDRPVKAWSKMAFRAYEHLLSDWMNTLIYSYQQCW